MRGDLRVTVHGPGPLREKLQSAVRDALRPRALTGDTVDMEHGWTDDRGRKSVIVHRRHGQHGRGVYTYRCGFVLSELLRARPRTRLARGERRVFRLAFESVHSLRREPIEGEG